MDVSEDLAEFWGMHAGDGTLYRTSAGSLVFELRGNHDERIFYENYVVPLLKRLYSYPWVVRDRSGGKNGCMGVRCCRREFSSLILAGGFPIGKKSGTVRIPPLVLQDVSLTIAFIRGYVSTDGCVHLAKVNGKAEPDYPTIQFSSLSHGIILDVQAALKSLGIQCYTWSSQSQRSKKPSLCLQVSGKERCSHFYGLVGIPNPNHLSRIADHIELGNP